MDKLLSILVVAATSATVLLGSGCTDTCDAGTTQTCTCAGGRTGAQMCSGDGSEWGACSCVGPGVDSGMPGTDSGTPGTDSGGPGTDSGGPGVDSGMPGADGGGDLDGGPEPPVDSGPRDAGEPPGPVPMCAMTARMATATLEEGSPGARMTAALVYFSGGALRSIDGVTCTVDSDRSGARGTCYDPYICGDCHIEIWYDASGRHMSGDCEIYAGFYSIP